MKKENYNKFEGTKQVNTILNDEEKKNIFSDDKVKARNAWLMMNKERLDEIENKRLAYGRAALVCQLITLAALLFNLIYHCL